MLEKKCLWTLWICDGLTGNGALYTMLKYIWLIATPSTTVADPGFPRGGGANSLGGGAPTYDFAKISHKLHEIERIWTPGGHASLALPLYLPLYDYILLWKLSIWFLLEK